MTTAEYYRDETERLRASLKHVIEYVETSAAKYEAIAEDEDGFMAQYFCGKADTYAGVAAVVNAAYCADYRTKAEKEAENGARVRCWRIYEGDSYVGFVCDKSKESAHRYANSIVANALLKEVTDDATEENGAEAEN